jgi:hypothetical protein
MKGVPLGENPRKMLILLLRAWVRVQASSFPHYFLCEKGTGIMATMVSGENPWFLAIAK